MHVHAAHLAIRSLSRIKIRVLIGSTPLQHGHTCSSRRFGDDRSSVLVGSGQPCRPLGTPCKSRDQLTLASPAYPSNHHQLSPPQYYRAAARNDAPMGVGRSPVGRVQYYGEVQCRATSAATNTYLFESPHVGSVWLLWEGGSVVPILVFFHRGDPVTYYQPVKPITNP